MLDEALRLGTLAELRPDFAGAEDARAQMAALAETTTASR